MLSLIFMVARMQSTELNFVRHAETVANSTGRYSVTTIDAFSPKGQAELKALTRHLLSSRPYDLILVSPSPRAMRTIFPYLYMKPQRALIWPLLDECCTSKRPANAHATQFQWGAQIRFPKDISHYFSLMPTEMRVPVASDYNAGLAQVEAEVREYRARFQHGRVLLVGHSGNGGQFIHALTGKWQKLDNAHVVTVIGGSGKTPPRAGKGIYPASPTMMKGAQK
jgi:broad specificity phosphatase PhoE